MKNSYHKYFLTLYIFILFISFFQPSIKAEVYPTQVVFEIRSDGETVVRDDFFEILEMDDYILVPLVSISRWLDLDLSYDRDNDLLTVYFEKNDKTVQIDLKHEIYYDFPEWSTDPPVVIEGDFYVATFLVNYLTNAKLLWSPRNQELILDYDYIEEDLDEMSEKIIKRRPKIIEKTPDITGPEVSIGSIHYKIGFDYKFAEDNNDDNLSAYNLINIHGRAGDWSLSADQELEYDFETEDTFLEYPYLNAKNTEQNRIIILGDNRFSLSNTLGRVNLRGLYLQYPLQQISERRAYTSVSGMAEEGSTIYLYVNDSLIGERYIYKDENKYYFDNVPLKINRTNVIRVVSKDIDNTEKEIVKKVAGSLYIFEKGTNEGIFALGNDNKSKESQTFIEIGGLKLKYAPTNDTSFFEEMAVNKVYDDNEYEGLIGGSQTRIAHRFNGLPLVIFGDWLVGYEIDLIEHGVRASTLYTKENGHISASISYVPPLVYNNVDSVLGQQALITFEHEINDNWLMDIDLENRRSILEMDKFDLSSVNISFDYSDKFRNKFLLITEFADREEDVYWNDISLTEKSRKWFEVILEGRSFRGPTRLSGEVNYNISDINYYEGEDAGGGLKREDYASVKFDISSTISEKLVLSGGLESSFTWFETSKLDSDSDINLRARLKTGDHTYITAGVSTENEYNKEENGNDFNEEVHKLELFLKHNIPRNLSLTAGVKKTYLEEENFFSSNLGLDYQKNDWNLGLDIEYISPYGSRENYQEIIVIELNKHLFSGMEAFLNLERDYVSSNSEEPVYEASIYFSQVLNFSKDRLVTQKYQRGNHSSYIAGLVYLDVNGNKNRELSEPLIEDITILRDGRKAITDEDGFYIFENVSPGLYEVGFDIRALPENYKVVTSDKVIEIQENENIYLEYGLTQMGTIEGQVKLENDIYEEENILLSHVELKILELNKTVFTKSDGSFVFKDVPLGKYKIKVMEKSLPQQTKIKDEEIYIIEVTPGNLNVKSVEVSLVKSD